MPRKLVSRSCKISECKRPHHARGYCQSHYNRLLRPLRDKPGPGSIPPSVQPPPPRSKPHPKDLAQDLAEICAEAISKIHIPPIKPPLIRVAPQHQPQSLHVMISDAHIGARVLPQDVGGIGEYNFDQFCKRLNRLSGRVDYFQSVYERPFSLEKLVIYFLGDMVSGESIFPAQPFYVDRMVVDQVFQGCAQFTQFLLGLAQVFPRIECFTVDGNHGRMGKKGSTHQRNNFDYIFYKTLKQSVAHQENIHFSISASPFMIVKHGSKIFQLGHGDNVRGWMGIPFYGLDRMARKLPGLTGLIINYVLIGHHHRAAQISIPQGDVLINGSMVGGDDFSINRLVESDLPYQVMFLFHPEEGIHSMTKIRLDDPVHLAPDSNGIYTSISVDET